MRLVKNSDGLHLVRSAAKHFSIGGIDGHKFAAIQFDDSDTDGSTFENVARWLRDREPELKFGVLLQR